MFLFPGAYAPFTMEGKVIVDGVLTSCYADIIDHDVAHFTMTPIQRFTELMNWIFGMTMDFLFLPVLQDIWASCYCQNSFGITKSVACDFNKLSEKLHSSKK